MQINHRLSVLNRLKTARGHLDAVVRMVEDDKTGTRTSTSTRDEAIAAPG